MAEEQQQPSGGGKGKIIVIIIVVLLLLIAGLVVAFMFLTQTPEESAQAVAGNSNAPQQTQTSNVMGETNARYLRIGPIFQLDQFIVNLLSQGGRRYLKISIGLEMTTANLENELNAKRALVRDIIIGILSSKSPEDISTTRGKDKMKEEIVQRLNENLVDGKIRNVFISDMAIQ
ncbi:flagellar basal body-associated FliL family protein [Helicobacter sp. 23-1045]